MANPHLDTNKNPKAWLTNDWLYQEIMRHIEPDLLLSNDELKELYSDDDEEALQERFERYQKAYHRYEEVAHQLKKGLEMDIITKRKTKRLKSIAEADKEAANVLNNLSDAIDEA